MRILLLSLFTLLFFSVSSHAQDEVRLITELGPGSENGFSDEAEIIGTVENSIAILDRGNIFISNGYSWGTKVLADVTVDSRLLHTRAELNEKLYFILELTSGYNLIEIDPSIPQLRYVLSDFPTISDMVAYKGELFMEVKDQNSDEYFTKVNPETSELTKIFDVNSFGGVRDVVVHNDLIYTIHWSTEKDGSYLASNNGTPGSVNEFYFFHDGSEFSRITSTNMTSAGENLFFWYNNGSNGYVLFVSDGTEQGTVELEDIFEPISFFDPDPNRAIGTIGNSIFFTAEEDGDFREYLWMSDGTVQGTEKISLIDGEAFPRFFTNYNDKLYFRSAHTSGGFSDLFGMIVTDGTAAGTQKAWDVSSNDLKHGEAWHLIEHNGKLFFDGDSNEFGSELYESDGTLENTKRLSDISPGDANGFTYNYRSAGDNLYFFGSTPDSGIELYVYGPATSETIDLTFDFSLSPNPAFEYLKIEGENLNGEIIRIYDLRGLLVKTTFVASNQVDIHDIAPGAYMLHLNKNNKTASQKFVKF